MSEQAFDISADVDFTKFTEDGHLSEAIKEGFGGFKFDAVKTALAGSSLSKKRVNEILKAFHNELEDAFVNWTESIDGSVSIALKNFDFEDGVTIKNPHEFCCKCFT
jgi:replication initiation and membrane attachment protein DnaB